MGAWSVEPFGNDVAGDWAWALTDSSGPGVIESAFDGVLGVPGGELLDADLGSVGLAAVEVVAKLLGRGIQSDSYTEEVDEWVASAGWVPDEGLRLRALAVLDRVGGRDSELRELWDDDDDPDGEFAEVIAALRAAVV